MQAALGRWCVHVAAGQSFSLSTHTMQRDHVHASCAVCNTSHLLRRVEACIAGEEYPISVLFKVTAVASQDAAGAAKTSGLFQSVLCATYWAATQDDAPLHPQQLCSTSLPRFSSPNCAVSGPDGWTAAAAWRPDEAGAIDVVGALVSVALTHSTAILAVPLAINARPFVPSSLRFRFCSLADMDQLNSYPAQTHAACIAAGYLTVDGHYMAVGGVSVSEMTRPCAKFGGQAAVLSVVTPLLPRDARALDNPHNHLDPSQKPLLAAWEPDVALPPPQAEMDQRTYQLFSQLSAAQHAALTPGRSHLHSLRQRPQTEHISSVLAPILLAVAHRFQGFNPQHASVGAAERVLLVEGTAMLEVHCFPPMSTAVPDVPSGHVRLLFLLCRLVKTP
jgi:hypothetical protein